MPPQWPKISDFPPRWENADLGAIEDSGPGFSAQPKCGHHFTLLSFVDAARALSEQDGLCLACCNDHGLRGRRP